jgi:hypothetical protein
VAVCKPAAVAKGEFWGLDASPPGNHSVLCVPVSLCFFALSFVRFCRCIGFNKMDALLVSTSDIYVKLVYV